MSTNERCLLTGVQMQKKPKKSCLSKKQSGPELSMIKILSTEYHGVLCNQVLIQSFSFSLLVCLLKAFFNYGDCENDAS